jgi:predicted Fe-S protein YdhL (DUF1289 family)
MILSPCVNRCKMDTVTRWCQGCFRSIEEITVWSRISDAERASILAAVTRRRQECGELATDDLPNTGDTPQR